MMINDIVNRAKMILLDVEGTTTPMDFVHKTLFNYSKEHMDEFIQNNSDAHEVAESLKQLKEQYAEDAKNHLELPSWPDVHGPGYLNSASTYSKWLVDRDSKLTSLKHIQGLIWERGFSSGGLKGKVYDDVPAAMERWSKFGKDICIYSSGSELSQKLIFKTTPQGDLTRYISSFFDTRIGDKRDADSYRRIAASKSLPPSSIIFFSDVPEELEAAEKAGFMTALVDREKKLVPGQERYMIVTSFENL